MRSHFQKIPSTTEISLKIANLPKTTYIFLEFLIFLANIRIKQKIFQIPLGVTNEKSQFPRKN